MRQVAIDAASIPKDAKIAALEKTSAESEKLIADARNDKMRQFEEMQFSQVNLKPKNYFLFVFSWLSKLLGRTLSQCLKSIKIVSYEFSRKKIKSVVSDFWRENSKCKQTSENQ